MDDNRRLSKTGGPVDDAHREIDPVSGQQKDYVVLSEEERAKGFIRPVRKSYIHSGINPVMYGRVLVKAGENGCGSLTKMSQNIAETYARNPKFYDGTFCVSCKKHFPLNEFIWEDGTQVGS